MSDIKLKLDEPIPSDAIAHREAYKNGPQLSYLSGAYVINRLNAVLGQGNWGYSINDMTKVFEGTIAQFSGEVFTTSYVARINFWASLEEKSTYGKGQANFEEVGYGDGSDKKSPGKAHELAVKEAVTDGLKRAAKNLGMSFGLQLYFKEGQYVGEEKAEVKEEVQSAGSNSTGANNTSSKSKKAVLPKVSRATIKNAFAILKDQKKITQEVFVSEYLNGSKTDALTDEQADAVLNKIKQNFPELGL